MRYDAFIRLSAELGCAGVELRDDLPTPLFDGDSPARAGEVARACEVRILALAEIKPFNDWSDDVQAQTIDLIKRAKACGAEAVSFIPRNDGKGMGNGERQANLRLALRELTHLLEEFDINGLIEPLGFESSSLRSKSEAVNAIEAVGAVGRIQLIHDTFHHYVAGGGPVFADYTGIVHISGLVDPAPALSQMRDEHRVLVDASDRLGNIEQLSALASDGYEGAISFEPFSPAIHDCDDPQHALSRSFEFIEAGLTGRAA
jgi:2-keto-myo-inositol isomerase